MTNPWSRLAEGEGGNLIRFDIVATTVWLVVEAVGVVVPNGFGVVAAALSVTMFAVGVAIFLQAFLMAVERSRTEEVSVAGLFFLMDNAAPMAQRRWLLGLLAVQTVASVTAASIRPFTALAFGILAPMFGLAIVGRWAADYGAFARRKVLRTKRAVRRPADEEDLSA